MQSSRLLRRQTARKILFFTNYFAPYRVGLFNELSRLSNQQVEFLFDNEIDPDRTWKINRKTIKFNYHIMNSKLDIIKKCLAIKPKFIISCEFGLRTILCIISGRIIKAKVIVFSELMPSSENSCSLLRKFVRKIIASMIDGGIAVGKESRQYLINIGVAKNKIVIAPDAVDNEFFIKESAKYKKEYLRNMFNIPAAYFVFIYVGSTSFRKGTDLLFRACKAVSRQTSKKILCLIVGDGIIKKSENNLLKYYDKKIIKIINFQQPRSLIRYLVLSDCLIFPTRNDVWGMVVNEAIACGLPVMASKYAGSTTELIDNGRDGYIFDPLNNSSFESTMLKCVNNRSVLKKFSNRAKSKLKLNNHTVAAGKIVNFLSEFSK